MARKSKWIILMLLFALLFMGFSNTNNVQGIQALNAGDQFLYTNNMYSVQHSNSSIFVDNAQYGYESYKYGDVSKSWEYGKRSYTIDSVYTDGIYVNFTESFYKTISDFQSDYYHYDYYSNNWVLDNHDAYYDENVNPYSTNQYQWMNTYPNLVFDISLDTWFSSCYYVGDAVQSFTINGIQIYRNVSIYEYQERTFDSYYVYWYDVVYTVNVTTDTAVTYYVDNETGITLLYTEEYNNTYYAFYDGYSDELNSNVLIYENYIYNETRSFYLIETTANFSPVSDADLPAMNFYYLPAVTNDTYYNFTVEIWDSSNNITLILEANDTYVTEWDNLVSGTYNFTVLQELLPYNGPSSSGYYLELNFILIDNSNPDHNTTWFMIIEDLRVRVPKWDCYLEGPEFLVFYENTVFDITVDVYADTSWSLDIYRYDGYSTTYLFSYYGYLNDTIWFSDGPLSSGNYSYEIYLIDDYNNTDSLYVEVNIEKSYTTWPSITGQFVGIGDYYYTINESTVLTYTFYDDNPDQYIVTLDGSEIASGYWFDGMTLEIYLDDYIQQPGIYILEIRIWDLDGHTATEMLTLHAQETAVSTETSTDTGTETSNTGANTISLDAPNVLTVVLSLVALASVAITIQKSKRINIKHR